MTEATPPFEIRKLPSVRGEGPRVCVLVNRTAQTKRDATLIIEFAKQHGAVLNDQLMIITRENDLIASLIHPSKLAGVMRTWGMGDNDAE